MKLCYIVNTLQYTEILTNKFLLVVGAESVSESERSVAALTNLPRTEWARILREHFTTGINSDNMDLINKAVFMVS